MSECATSCVKSVHLSANVINRQQEADVMTDRIIRTRECCDMVSFSNVHLRRLEQRGEFPARFKLANDSGKSGACGWRLSDVENWIEARADTTGHRA